MIEWKYNSDRQRYNNVFPTGNEMQKIRFRFFYASLLFYYYYYYPDDYTYRHYRRCCTAEKRDSGSQKCKTARPPPVTDDHWLRYSLIRSITAVANRRRRRRTVVCYYFGPVRFCFWIIIVYTNCLPLIFYFSLANRLLFELPSDPFHLLSDAHVPHTPIRHRPSSRYIVNVRHYVVVAVRVAAEWRFPYRRWWCSPTDPTVDVR